MRVYVRMSAAGGVFLPSHVDSYSLIWQFIKVDSLFGLMQI